MYTAYVAPIDHANCKPLGKFTDSQLIEMVESGELLRTSLISTAASALPQECSAWPFLREPLFWRTTWAVWGSGALKAINSNFAAVARGSPKELTLRRDTWDRQKFIKTFCEELSPEPGEFLVAYIIDGMITNRRIRVIRNSSIVVLKDHWKTAMLSNIVSFDVAKRRIKCLMQNGERLDIGGLEEDRTPAALKFCLDSRSSELFAAGKLDESALVKQHDSNRVAEVEETERKTQERMYGSLNYMWPVAGVAFVLYMTGVLPNMMSVFGIMIFSMIILGIITSLKR